MTDKEAITAAKELRDWCKSHQSCNLCPFYEEATKWKNDGCRLAKSPAFYKLGRLALRNGGAE